MGLLDKLKSFFSGPPPHQDFHMVVPSAPSEIEEAVKSRSKLLGRSLSYEHSGDDRSFGRNSEFSSPIYELSEIARAADVEPYVAQSVRKHREQILKEGFAIQGPDDEMVEYVKERLFEMAVVSGVPLASVLREVVTNLVTFHTAYVVFRRDALRSSGSVIKMYGKLRLPVAGVFSADPTTFTVKVDKYGTPKMWKQSVDGSGTEASVRLFNPEDVISITMDKKSGFSFGTPYIMPVLDDIRALRRMEEIAIMVAAKEAFPLYHYKVGTPERPAMQYEDGEDEISIVRSEITNMPLQGNIITSERHEINLISKDGGALDIVPFLNYFEARVLAGLRLSPLDLGRGGTSNRGTATNINKSVQDAAKDYQEVISDCLTYGLVLPILLEGGYDVTHDTMVRLIFPMIDREELRAHQNHGLQLFLASTISESEFRKDYLNLQPMSDEERELTTRQLDLEVAKQESAMGPETVTGTRMTTKKVSRQANNRGQPQNQFGTKPAKTKVKANDYLRVLDSKFRNFQTEVEKISSVAEISALNQIERSYKAFVDSCSRASKSCLDDFIDQGIEEAMNFLEIEDSGIGSRSRDRFYHNFVTKSFWKVGSPMLKSIALALKSDQEGHTQSFKNIGYFSALRTSLTRLAKDQMETARRFGMAKILKKHKLNRMLLVNDELGYRKTLELGNGKIVYKNLIPELKEPTLKLKSESDSEA